MPARLIEVALRVADIDASARFYRDVVGVALERQEPHAPDPQPHYSASWGRWERAEGDFALFLIYPARDGRAGPSEIAFAVESLDDVQARAETAGVEILELPRPLPWGRGAKYADPDGNLVSVVEPPR